MPRGAGQITDGRPFSTSEHGPIHTFKDHDITLPEAFDDEYFRYIQWEHLASGGAGGGMRWPNRDPPISCTAGMRRAQRALAGFLPLIDWVRVQPASSLAGAATVDSQAESTCSRAATIEPGRSLPAAIAIASVPDGMLERASWPISPTVALPDMAPGSYRIVAWDTVAGRACEHSTLQHGGGPLVLRAGRLVADRAIAVRALGPG